MPAFRRFAAAVSCLVAVGCGGSQDTGGPREPAFPVFGVVKVKGVPAFEARVIAVPAGSTPETSPQFDAITNEKGEFRFGMNTETDGLPPGKYDIRITWPDIVRRHEPEREIDQLNGRYNQPKKPAFTIEVKSGDNTLPPFELK